MNLFSYFNLTNQEKEQFEFIKLHFERLTGRKQSYVSTVRILIQQKYSNMQKRLEDQKIVEREKEQQKTLD